MPTKIEEDHKHFIDKIKGKVSKNLKKDIKSGKILGKRGKDGKFVAEGPRLDIPHLVFGPNTKGGVGRGEGAEGETIGHDDPKGEGKPKASQDEGNPIRVQIDLEDVLNLMEDELKLPRLLPKPSPTYEDIDYRYTGISMVGPESLRHNRRTYYQALKRTASSGDMHKMHAVPGYSRPVKLVTPIQSDKRYRQYKEILQPTNNAVLFFMRDGSGSMDGDKIDIVSDLAWWLEAWISRSYKKIAKCYIWHDVKAQEVDSQTWYEMRDGGGTNCSSAFKKAMEIIDERYPPETWNIYPFYFTDGDNWSGDNSVLLETLINEMTPDVVNQIGIAQVLSWNYSDSVKKCIDDAIEEGTLFQDYIHTVSVGDEESPDSVSSSYVEPSLKGDKRWKETKKALSKLLGVEETD